MDLSHKSYRTFELEPLQGYFFPFAIDTLRVLTVSLRAFTRRKASLYNRVYQQKKQCPSIDSIPCKRICIVEIAFHDSYTNSI